MSGAAGQRRQSLVAFDESGSLLPESEDALLRLANADRSHLSRSELDTLITVLGGVADEARAEAHAANENAARWRAELSAAGDTISRQRESLAKLSVVEPRRRPGELYFPDRYAKRDAERVARWALRTLPPALAGEVIRAFCFKRKIPKITAAAIEDSAVRREAAHRGLDLLPKK